MGQISRCPLIGNPCPKPITIEEKSFFLAEAEKPESDKQWRREVLTTVLEREHQYKIRSALDESDVNAFTCKICEMIQTCAYGVADITGSNPNVLLELGMMIALGKTTIILVKREQEQELKLPSDIIDKEVIPFSDYTEIMPKLRQMVQNLPLPVTPANPMQEIEKIRPQIADELSRVFTGTVKEFKDIIAEAKLDTVSFSEEKKELPPELDERLVNLEAKLEDITRLGFTTDAETASSRAHYFYNLGKYEEALANLNWSLELEPDNHITLNNRGLTYAKLERYDEALADYNRALELRPDDPGTLYNLACLFSLQKKTDDALDYLEKAISKDNKFREMAKTDEDFNNIRDDPRFNKIIETD